MLVIKKILNEINLIGITPKINMSVLFGKIAHTKDEKWEKYKNTQKEKVEDMWFTWFG